MVCLSVHLLVNCSLVSTVNNTGANIHVHVSDFLKNLLGYNWLTVLCLFQRCSRVNQAPSSSLGANNGWLSVCLSFWDFASLWYSFSGIRTPVSATLLEGYLCWRWESLVVASSSLVAQSYLTVCDPLDCKPTRLLCPWGFSTQEYWSGLPLPGHLPHPGIKPTSLMSSALAGKFFTTSDTWEAPQKGYKWTYLQNRSRGIDKQTWLPGSKGGEREIGKSGLT